MASFINEMQKIVSFTSKLVGAVNSNAIGANIPTNTIMQALGIEDDLSFNSVADTIESLNELKDTAVYGINMARCAIVMATNEKGQTGNFLAAMEQSLVGAIASVVNQIWDAVAIQVSNAVGQIIGTFLNIVKSLQSLLTSVLLLFDSIKNFIVGLADFAKLRFELLLKQEQCASFLSSIAACLLNKYLGPYLDQFTNSVVGKINEFGNNFNEALYEGLQDANVFASYAQQEAFLMKKASLQINGLTPTALFGANQ